MRLVYLIPPSEGKRDGGDNLPLSRSFELPIPSKILKSAKEKDLKCIGRRFAEAKELNKNILSGSTLPAIDRYDGVMYSAIGYESMSCDAKSCFDDSVLIVSGLFGVLRPYDRIPNYKLPIEAKWLAAYWKPKVTKLLASMKDDVVFVDLLPLSYRKMVDWEKVGRYVTIDFVDTERNRLWHDVKPVKGKWLRNAMEKGILSIDDLNLKGGVSSDSTTNSLFVSSFA
jgi:uncharacterized protein